MRTIAVINQKGGCGKTTTAINLGACLGRSGLRTLLLDMDSQSHCAAGLGIPDARVDLDTSDLLRASGRKALDQSRLLWRAARRLDLIPSRPRLAALESGTSDFSRQPQRERALSRALSDFGDRYDVCVIDCPPSIGLLAFNALVAADLVLIPVETGYFSLQGATRQLATVRAVAKRLDTPLRCLVLPTLHEPGLSVADDLLDELKRRFRTRLAPVTVERDGALREAASFGRPVIEHAPDSSGARNYAELARFLIENEHLSPLAQTDEDWSDLERYGDEPLPRPLRNPSESGHEVAPTEPAAGEPSGPGLISSVTCVEDEPVGPVIVTLSTGETHAALAEKVNATEAGTRSPTRAEELARRTARPNGTTATSASPAPVKRTQSKPGNGHPRQFGAMMAPGGVLFVQPRALGEEVAVSGEFNGWGSTPLDLNPETGLLEALVPLRRGRHQYRLQVDGHSIADPYNPDWILDETGRPNSLIEVPEMEQPGVDLEMRCGAD